MTRRSHRRPAFSLFAFQDIITSVTGVVILTTLLLTLELIQRELASAAHVPPQVHATLSREIEEAERELGRMMEEVRRSEQKLADVEAVAGGRIEATIAQLRQEIVQLRDAASRWNSQEQLLAKQRDQLRAENRQLDPKQVELAQLQREAVRAREKIEELRNSNRLIYNPVAGSGKTAWLVDLSPERLLVAAVGRTEPPVQLSASASSWQRSNFVRWLADRDPRIDYFVLLVRPDATDVYEEVRTILELRNFDLGIDLIGSDATVVDPSKGTGF
ncbi:MAG: hypothetical protein KY475_21530 [Planctomycetes bacterium]|nr:hypothetical protein [Planctomycetota bacterium]